jgi:hypothetical protein
MKTAAPKHDSAKAGMTDDIQTAASYDPASQLFRRPPTSDISSVFP